jgi:ribosomal protein S27AE
MAELVKRMWCPQCGDYGRSTSPGTNHLLHFIITLVLFVLSLPIFGTLALLWVVVWIVASTDRRWRCGECGARTKAVPGKAKADSVAYKIGKAFRARKADS